MNNYTLENLNPFGVVVRRAGGQRSIEQFTERDIFDLLAAHKVVVFRGYDLLPKPDLALFAQRLGEPLQWAFGAINDLKVKPDTENYIFTDHEVPFHWDGAFIGKIPHIILFQCITAPKKEDMGGTTFSDTSKIVRQSDPERLRRWEKISVTYTTEKIVHYGGTITQTLLQKHPVLGQTVIRFAEPVEDLNPVTLNVKGLQNHTPAEFTGEMRKLLYDDEFLYTHRWEDGDLVLADNHTLLHGREAFKNPNRRYLQRINILSRPDRFSLARFLKNCLTIRRKEFFTAELPIFLIPIFLSISSFADLLQPAFLFGLIAIFLLFNLGDMINCYADYKLDAIYKSHLSNAVYELGKRNVMTQIIVSGLAAVALTIWVSFSSQKFYLIPITIFGIFVGLEYSIGPLKFKSRGVAQLFCLWGIIFFGPMLYTAIIAGNFPGFLPLLIYAAYGFQQMGIIMLNTAEDYTEDLNAGLRTIIVALGLHRAMRLAWLLTTFSGLALQLLLLLLFSKFRAPIYAQLSILALTFGWLKIIIEYKNILRKISGLDEKAATGELKKNGMKVPEWLKIGAYTTLFAVLILFIWKA